MSIRVYHGDTLIVAVPSNVPESHLEEIRQLIAKRMPGVIVAASNGITEHIVFRELPHE